MTLLVISHETEHVVQAVHVVSNNILYKYWLIMTCKLYLCLLQGFVAEAFRVL